MYTNKLLTVKEADGLQNEIQALSCKRRLHLDGHMHMSGCREGAVSEIWAAQAVYPGGRGGGWGVGARYPSDWQHPIHVIKSAMDLFLVENAKQSKFRLTSMWRSFPLYTASQYNGSKIQCMIRILTWKVIFNAILVYFHVHRILGVLWHCPSYISITLSHSFSSHCPSCQVFYWDFWKWAHLCIAHFQSDGVLLLMIEKEKEEYGMYLMDGENEERKKILMELFL